MGPTRQERLRSRFPTYRGAAMLLLSPGLLAIGCYKLSDASGLRPVVQEQKGELMSSKSTEEPAPAAKQSAEATGFEGALHYKDPKTFRGWAWDRRAPDLPVKVDIYDGETLLGTVTSDVYRPDLLKAGKGDGKHGFVYPIPSGLRDGRPHLIRARISGTKFELRRNPDPFMYSSS